MNYLDFLLTIQLAKNPECYQVTPGTITNLPFRENHQRACGIYEKLECQRISMPNNNKIFLTSLSCLYMSIKVTHERDTVVILPVKAHLLFAHDILPSAGNRYSLQKLPAENSMKS